MIMKNSQKKMNYIMTLYNNQYKYEHKIKFIRNYKY